MNDPYVDPRTGVLTNLLGCTEAEQLARLEHVHVQLRDQELLSRPVPGGFDLAHLQRVHGALFQDVYAWAGQLRTVQISKGIPFAAPQFIRDEATRVFSRLAANDYLRGLPLDGFVEAATDLLADINALHPFREGNGRTQRAFLRQLSREAGYQLDWSGVDAEVNNAASRASLIGENDDLRKALAGITTALSTEPVNEAPSPNHANKTEPET